MEHFLICGNPFCRFVLDLQEVRKPLRRSQLLLKECPERRAMVGHLPVLHPTIECNVARPPRALRALPSPVSHARRCVMAAARGGCAIPEYLAARDMRLSDHLRNRRIPIHASNSSLHSPTYVSAITPQVAEKRNFWSHYGCASILVFVLIGPTEHCCSPQGTNPPIRIALVL